MGFALGKLTSVENGCTDSNTAYRNPAFDASIAADTPATPPPMITRSSKSSRFPAWKSGSCKISLTAFAPVCEENLSRGMPVRSPTIRTPGRFETPPSPETGNFSTTPAGHLVCSQLVYRCRSDITAECATPRVGMVNRKAVLLRVDSRDRTQNLQLMALPSE